MSDNNSTVASMCSPAIVYLCFSLIQIIVDIYKKQFNTAFFKFWVMILVTTMLNILCERGMGIISWLIVFIPLILMTVLILVLIYFVGFRPGQPNKVFNNDPAQKSKNLRSQMMSNHNQMTQQVQQMNNINQQTTLPTNNTPANTLEINPLAQESFKNPINITNNMDKNVQESFQSTHQNSTSNNYKSSFLSPETFFSY